MKRWCLLALMLLMLLLCVCTAAQAEDAPVETEDSATQFVVDAEAGLSEATGEGPLSVGTDVYLYVDPASASNVTFWVQDEDGKPISGASIYIVYQGVSELYGVTGSDGKCSFYLFRNVQYGYKVVKSGYESVTGSFTATQETKTVRVTMRKYRRLTVNVKQDGKPLPGAQVLIDGESFTSDANGAVSANRVNGNYTITVIAPDDREISRVVSVNGADVNLTLDFKADDTIVPGGMTSDRFLVFDRDYLPEDYVLTEYAFRAEDVARMDEETQEEYEERVACYLAENTDTISVEAQCDRIQQAEGLADVDVQRDTGELWYTQRSMMPSGWLLRAWEDREYDQLAFANENAALLVQLDDLHTGDMAKIFALARAMEEQKSELNNLLKEDVSFAESGYKALTGKKKADLSELDLNLMRDWKFEFDLEAGEEWEDILPAKLYRNAQFEFRITPIEPENLRAMVRAALTGTQKAENGEVMLANSGYFIEKLRRLEAEGELNRNERAELEAFVLDGRLEEEEIEELRLLQRKGELSDAAVDALIAEAIEGHIYRVSAWLRYRGVELEITDYMPGLTLSYNADAPYEAEYALQLEQLKEELGEDVELTAEFLKELVQCTEAALAEKYGFFAVAHEGIDFSDEEYEPGINTGDAPVELLRTLPDEEHAFYELLCSKRFRMLTADVRREEEKEYRVSLDAEHTLLSLQHALIWNLPQNGLFGLEPLELEAVEMEEN